MLAVLTDVVLPVLLVAAVGGWAGRKLGLSTETLSNAVFYLFSPALVFSSLASVSVDASDVARIVAVTVGVFVVNIGLATGWSILAGRDRDARAVAVIGAGLANQGNMGLPMAKLAFGRRGLEIAVLIFVVGVVLWSSLGIAAGAMAKGEHTARAALTTPFRYPAIYAAIAGVVVNLAGIELPVAVRESVSTLGQASIPVMLVILGLSFRMPTREGLGVPLAVSVNRLIVGPLVAVGLAALVGLGGVAGDTTIMQAGMPTAVMTTVIALQLRISSEMVVRTIIVSTFLSIGTLTVLISLLR